MNYRPVSRRIDERSFYLGAVCGVLIIMFSILFLVALTGPEPLCSEPQHEQHSTIDTRIAPRQLVRVSATGYRDLSHPASLDNQSADGPLLLK